MNANPHPALLERFQALGASIDCASGGELDRAARLGLGPDRTFYAGPGKQTHELAQALRQGVRIQAEGWEDLARLEALAEGPVAVNLRVHPAGGIQEANRIIGGTGPSAFGVDEEDLPALLAAHPWFQGELILEPGRFLAGPCVYLARVIRVKESRGVRFVILEAGVNHLLRPLLTGEPFPVRAVGKAGPLRPATLAGPLCTSLDRLGDVLLPELEPGSLLAFGMVGAYGFTEAMAPFLSHPVAKEIPVG